MFWNPNLDPSDCLYSLDLRSVACRTGLLGCGPTVVAYFHQQTIINSTRHYNNRQTAALASGNFLVVYLSPDTHKHDLFEVLRAGKDMHRRVY